MIVSDHKNLPHFDLADWYLRGMEDKTSPNKTLSIVGSLYPAWGVSCEYRSTIVTMSLASQ